MSRITKCIYCADPANLKGEGDHVIPGTLGEFRNDKHFKRICTRCNNRIGKSENVLLLIFAVLM
jgi:5-methylcytosine-specific restriction endonuclease McrA